MPAPLIDASIQRDEINVYAQQLYLERTHGKISADEYCESIVLRVYRPLQGFISNGLCVPRSEQDDYAQEIILRFLKSQPKPDLTTVPIMNWLYRAAYNHKIDLWRKKAIRKEQPLTEATYVLSGAPFHSTEWNLMLTLALNAAFKSLDAKFASNKVASTKHEDALRAVAYLCLVEGYSQHEAAGMLDLPETTVNYYVQRAKSILKASGQLQRFYLRMRTGVTHA